MWILLNCVTNSISSGANRARYLQLLFSGLYTPWTLPVGSSERALQSLVDRLLVTLRLLARIGSIFSDWSSYFCNIFNKYD